MFIVVGGDKIYMRRLIGKILLSLTATAYAASGDINDAQNLQIAKSYLLQGQISRAQNQLNRITKRNYALREVELHYQALIYLIQDRYADLLQVLSSDNIAPGPRYGNVCLLKVLAHLALGQFGAARIEFNICASYISSDSNNDLIWPELLMRFPQPQMNEEQELLFLNPYDRQLLAKNEYVRPWLKFGLLQKNRRLDQAMLQQIVPEAFQDPQIRELAGIISYQREDYKQALFFAEDIDSSTIHNLRGNEFLKQQAYPQAWEEFQQALSLNRYSHNALARSIPLAIQDRHWEDGLKFTATQSAQVIDPTTLALLRSYFLLIGKQISPAKRVLAELGNNHHFAQSLRYQLLMAYFALLDKNPVLLGTSVAQACQLDAHYCWPLANFLVWPSDPKITPSIFNSSAHATTPDPEEIVSHLRHPPAEASFIEEAFISQEQIDQLDQMPLILNP